MSRFASVFAPFLVGEMQRTQRAPGDPRAGGVLLANCTVLRQSGCSGLCIHMCKLPSERAFAEHWGTPPAMQTRDYRPLPGGYGHGSSTEAKWIEANIARDAKKESSSQWS